MEKISHKPICLSKIEFIWVSNYYDFPLEGLCKFRGKTCVFRTDYEDAKCDVYMLTFLEKIRWQKDRYAWEFLIEKRGALGVIGKSPIQGFIDRQLVRIYYWISSQ